MCSATLLLPTPSPAISTSWYPFKNLLPVTVDISYINFCLWNFSGAASGTSNTAIWYNASVDHPGTPSFRKSEFNQNCWSKPICLISIFCLGGICFSQTKLWVGLKAYWDCPNVFKTSGLNIKLAGVCSKNKLLSPKLRKEIGKEIFKGSEALGRLRYSGQSGWNDFRSKIKPLIGKVLAVKGGEN